MRKIIERYSHIQAEDPELYASIQREIDRQITGIELIASENYVSSAVLDAMGSILTNKYSEGFPGKRYYKGNQYIDEIENLTIERVKKLFGAQHANVQAYSGSPANLAVHFGLIAPGESTMGMELSAGGHLTHGFKVSFSGKLYNSVNYGVNDEGLIDYDAVAQLARDHKPKLIWTGASAYSRVIDFARFREIADQVGAILVADIAHIAGLIVAGEHPSPVGFADIVTSTTHKTLRGPRGAFILCKAEYSEKIDKAIFPGLQGGPHNHTTAAISVALKEAATPEFRQYGQQVVKNSKRLSEELAKLGYKIVSGGTDNHLFLIDVTAKFPQFGGEAVSQYLESVNISVNKNTIPNDTRKPWDPSGIRIGTAAVSSRGLVEGDMVHVASFIDRTLANHQDHAELERIRGEVGEFMQKFPIPGLYEV